MLCSPIIPTGVLKYELCGNYGMHSLDILREDKEFKYRMDSKDYRTRSGNVEMVVGEVGNWAPDSKRIQNKHAQICTEWMHERERARRIAI